MHVCGFSGIKRKGMLSRWMVVGFGRWHIKVGLLGFILCLIFNQDSRRYWWRCMWPAWQNLCPIYDHNLWFSLTYLWPDKKFDASFMTVAADTVALNIISEGLVFMILLSITRKLWLLLKTSNSRLDYQKNTSYMTKVANSMPYLCPKHLKNHTLWGCREPI